MKIVEAWAWLHDENGVNIYQVDGRIILDITPERSHKFEGQVPVRIIVGEESIAEFEKMRECYDNIKLAEAEREKTPPSLEDIADTEDEIERSKNGTAL
ncbi:MAG: hypothetical protein Q8O19_06455 [Rectinemataceae bacterium]|nr:hypothetical protein [Rectinemataceae bacterium]